jgi:hypothetical protein
MRDSGVIAPAIIERLSLIDALIARAANHSLNHKGIKKLEGLFGNDLGEEKSS